MELIVISSPLALADESILINSLFMAGLKCFHIRKPESEMQSVKDLLNGIEPRFYDRIALHQFHQMANEYGIKRLHYTEQARETSTTAQWQNLVDNGFTLSSSVHQISMLPGLTLFEYVFYGPVFNSISKPGYKSKLTAGFKLDKSNIKPKVMALGGVEHSNLSTLKPMGFDGAAVLGTIWKEPDQAVKRFHELTRNLPIQNENND